MRLKEYLDKYHMCYKHVAADLGISESTMYAIFRGEYDPRISFMKKVEVYTQKNVRVKDWYDDSMAEKENIA